MLSVRQSSDCGRSKSPMTWASRERPCGAIGPSLVASRTPLPRRHRLRRLEPQLADRRARRKGTPRNTAMPFSRAPRSSPALVRTTRSSVAVVRHDQTSLHRRAKRRSNGTITSRSPAMKISTMAKQRGKEGRAVGRGLGPQHQVADPARRAEQFRDQRDLPGDAVGDAGRGKAVGHQQRQGQAPEDARAPAGEAVGPSP